MTRSRTSSFLFSISSSLALKVERADLDMSSSSTDSWLLKLRLPERCWLSCCRGGCDWGCGGGSGGGGCCSGCSIVSIAPPLQQPRFPTYFLSLCVSLGQWNLSFSLTKSRAFASRMRQRREENAWKNRLALKREAPNPHLFYLVIIYYFYFSSEEMEIWGTKRTKNTAEMTQLPPTAWDADGFPFLFFPNNVILSRKFYSAVDKLISNH